MKIKKINLEAFQGEELTDLEKVLVMAGSGVSNCMGEWTQTAQADGDNVPADSEG